MRPLGLGDFLLLVLGKNQAIGLCTQVGQWESWSMGLGLGVCGGGGGLFDWVSSCERPLRKRVKPKGDGCSGLPPSRSPWSKVGALLMWLLGGVESFTRSLGP